MRSLNKPILTLLFALSTAAVFAQKPAESKPQMFAAFPETFTCSVDQLSKAFDTKEGEIIRFTSSDNFVFSGRVNSNINKYNNLQSMVIESDNYDHAIFHLSKQILGGKQTIYVGRILHRGKSDGLMLTHDEKGNYSFKKINTENILQDCSSVK